ncbi:alpha/beta hydrolase, partial [Streptomyces sp. RP5T]
MPNPPRPRFTALAATVLLLASALAGCGDNSGNEDLSAQKLNWKDCPAPSPAEGGGE